MKDQEIQWTYENSDEWLGDDPAYLAWLDSLRHEEREADQMSETEAPF